MRPRADGMTRGTPERCGRCDARQQSEIAKPLCISMAVYLCNLRIDKQQIIPAFSRIHTGAAFAYTHRRPAKRVPAAPGETFGFLPGLVTPFGATAVPILTGMS